MFISTQELHIQWQRLLHHRMECIDSHGWLGFCQVSVYRDINSAPYIMARHQQFYQLSMLHLEFHLNKMSVYFNNYWFIRRFWPIRNLPFCANSQTKSPERSTSYSFFSNSSPLKETKAKCLSGITLAGNRSCSWKARPTKILLPSASRPALMAKISQKW